MAARGSLSHRQLTHVRCCTEQVQKLQQCHRALLPLLHPTKKGSPLHWQDRASQSPPPAAPMPASATQQAFASPSAGGQQASVAAAQPAGPADDAEAEGLQEEVARHDGVAPWEVSCASLTCKICL
jgi:hypothetical protein